MDSQLQVPELFPDNQPVQWTNKKIKILKFRPVWSAFLYMWGPELTKKEYTNNVSATLPDDRTVSFFKSIILINMCMSLYHGKKFCIQ